MIRVQALLCKLNSLKISDSELFLLFTQDSKRHCKYTCPCCGNGNDLHYHTSYNRMMISIRRGKRFEETISIRRIICPCGHTHALIPDFLIPYGSYSIRFILSVLFHYLGRKCSVAALCDYYQISISTFYDWKKLFTNHYNLFIGAINEISRLSYSSLIPFLILAHFHLNSLTDLGFRFCKNRIKRQNQIALDFPLSTHFVATRFRN